MGATPLVLPVGATENSVRVSPVVLLTIADAYIRRADGQGRVIGTLLGTVGDSMVDIKNCYAVPHSEANEQVAVDVQHHQTMATLHARVNPRERVVGWFSTGGEVSGSDALLHSFYADQCRNPVHITLDTTASSGEGGHMGVRAFVSRALSIQGRELAREFQEVACEVRAVEAERVGADLLAADLAERLPGEAEGLQESLGRLAQSLAAAQEYVDAVASGEQQGSVAVGRQLAEAVAAVPHLTPEHFERVLQDQQNDVTLVMFLSNLIRTHIALADKLGTMQLPLL